MFLQIRGWCETRTHGGNRATAKATATSATAAAAATAATATAATTATTAAAATAAATAAAATATTIVIGTATVKQQQKQQQ